MFLKVFESLIEGFRSWEYRIRYQLDLLYILIFQIPRRLIFYHEVIFFARRSSRRGLLGKVFDKLWIQGRMQIFEKMSQSALNQVLTLSDYRTQQMLQIPLKIMDLQSDFNILVARQWKLRISVPMSCMRLFVNLVVQQCDKSEKMKIVRTYENGQHWNLQKLIILEDFSQNGLQIWIQRSFLQHGASLTFDTVWTIMFFFCCS